MASAFKAAPAPRLKPEDGREARAPRRPASDWLRCTPETPWGVHGEIREDRCTRCGWQA